MGLGESTALRRPDLTAVDGQLPGQPCAIASPTAETRVVVRARVVSTTLSWLRRELWSARRGRSARWGDGCTTDEADCRKG